MITYCHLIFWMGEESIPFLTPNVVNSFPSLAREGLGMGLKIIKMNLYIQQLFRVAILCCMTCIVVSCSGTKKMAEDAKINETPKAEDAKEQGIPIMTFDKVMHDFGIMNIGEKRSTTYTFTNTGTVDLVIDIVTSCHCTTLDYSTTPVKPGESGVIKATFDSSSKKEDEVIDITIVLKNEYPENGYPIVEEVKYTYHLTSE